MAHLGVSRILAAKGGYPVQDSSRDPGSLYGNVGYLDRKRGLSARREVRKKEENEQRRAQPKTIVVEQWICFALGFVCMAFGFWGICMEPGQRALPTYVTWLGSLYEPALRVTAVACLGMGLVLLRRGWTDL
jgi:hypothetical protein